MDFTTILFIFLGVALAIYILVMIEAATDRGIKLKKKPFEEKGEEEASKEAQKEKEPHWPPEEESS